MIDETLRKTADYQMLHASFNPDIGLLNGRMGIILAAQRMLDKGILNLSDD